MRAPIRLVRGGWPTFMNVRAGRLMRDDPRSVATGEANAETFRSVMSLLHVGDTIKITGLRRHGPADDLLLEHVALAGKRFVDLGASDGSTSAELIARISDFQSYVIADLYLYVRAAVGARHVLFYDNVGTCTLVAGRRVIAWPSLSKLVRTLYRPLLSAVESGRFELREVLLLNPEVRALMATDPRIRAQVQDVFAPLPDRDADVIKVANLLRRLYFSDEDISRGLHALHASLADDGYLLIVDNPRISSIAVRGSLYQRTDEGFISIAHTTHRAEIDDLVSAVRVD